MELSFWWDCCRLRSCSLRWAGRPTLCTACGGDGGGSAIANWKESGKIAISVTHFMRFKDGGNLWTKETVASVTKFDWFPACRKIMPGLKYDCAGIDRGSLLSSRYLSSGKSKIDARYTICTKSWFQNYYFVVLSRALQRLRLASHLYLPTQQLS